MEIVKSDRNGIARAVEMLKAGKSVAYPTDTSYGLAVDATNTAAIRELYRIKERGFGKPVHVVIPSFAYASLIAKVTSPARRLFKKFLPGPFTLVLPLKSRARGLELLSAGSGTIGVRMPNHPVALALVRKLGRPITTTSANPSAHLSGGYDSYSARDVFEQFKHKKRQPDLILDAGQLRTRKPSTIVALIGERVTILRQGPISKKVIFQALQ